MGALLVSLNFLWGILHTSTVDECSFRLQTNVETMLEKMEKNVDKLTKENEEMKAQIGETREKSEHLIQIQEKLDLILKSMANGADVARDRNRRPK